MVCDIYGGERGRIDYLTEDRQPGTCFVLRGEPNVTEDIINSLDFKQRFLSGVIAWHPQDTPSEEQENEVMDLYERHFSRGQNLNFLWVKHTDKGRAELHFVIPQVELDGGRQFQPYYHGRYGSAFKNVDFARFAKLSEALNIRHDWKSGIDPRSQLHSAPDKSHYKQSSRDFKSSIHAAMRAMFYANQLPDREAVVAVLENNSALKIVKVTKHSISVLRSDDQKPIRLKGLWFEEDYSPAKITKSREFAALGDEEKQTRADELLEAAQSALSKRIETDRIRYKPKPELILKPKNNERTPIRTPAPDLPFAQELHTANRSRISRGKQEYLDRLREEIEQPGEADPVTRIIELSVECSARYKGAAKLVGGCSEQPDAKAQQPERGDHAIASGGRDLEKGADLDERIEHWTGIAQQSSDVATGWINLALQSHDLAGETADRTGRAVERVLQETIRECIGKIIARSGESQDRANARVGETLARAGERIDQSQNLVAERFRLLQRGLAEFLERAVAEREKWTAQVTDRTRKLGDWIREIFESSARRINRVAEKVRLKPTPESPPTLSPEDLKNLGDCQKEMTRYADYLKTQPGYESEAQENTVMALGIQRGLTIHQNKEQQKDPVQKDDATPPGPSIPKQKQDDHTPNL